MQCPATLYHRVPSRIPWKKNLYRKKLNVFLHKVIPEVDFTLSILKLAFDLPLTTQELYEKAKLNFLITLTITTVLQMSKTLVKFPHI